MRAALRFMARARPGGHERRPRADRGRPDRRGGGGVHRAAAGARRGAGGADLGDPRAPAQPLAQPRRGRRSAPRNRKQALVPDGATVLEPVGTAPGLVVPPAPPTVLVLPGPPRELQPMWETALETPLMAELLSRRGHLRAADHAAVRDPGVGDRALAARDRGRRRPDRAARDHHLPAPRGDRDRDRVRAAGRRRVRRSSRRRSASATPTRCSPRTARRSTTR